MSVTNATTTNPSGNAKDKNVIIGIIAVAVITVVAFFGIRNINRNANNKNVIKIGANLSLTGPMAYWSTQLKNGLDLAIEQFSDNGVKVQIIYEDNHGEAKSGVTALHKLRNNNICALITAHTSIALPQQTIAAQNKIPLIGAIVGTSDFGTKNEWSFLDWLTHEDITPPLVEYIINKLYAKSAVMLVVNDDYGKDGAALFSAQFINAGGKILGEEVVKNDEKDVRSILTKLISLNPDVLYTVTREETLISVIKQSAELGFKGHIVGEHSMASSSVVAGAPANMELIFAGSKGIAEIDKSEPHFVDIYKKRFGETPDWVSLYGYSIGEYLIPVVQKSRGNPELIRQMLSELDMATVRGNVVMSADRKIQMQGVVYSRKDNQCKIVAGNE